MRPAILSDPEQMLALVEKQKREGRRVGLVPTMGALHDGHLSLVKRCTGETDFTIVTIFVNPTQFGPGEDLDKYPRNLQQDTDLLSQFDVHAVFAPDVDTMYPPGATTSVLPGNVAKPFEGALRPGHFEGVATIVLKLFQLIPADVAYFGQKDYQQTQVIQQMIKDFHLPINMSVCPIVRDEDGLALSSRNSYLSAVERQQAVGLSRALFHIRDLAASGNSDAASLLKAASQILADASIDQIDYVALVDKQSLEPVQRVDENTIAIGAVRIGATRLIDNVLLDQ